MSSADPRAGGDRRQPERVGRVAQRDAGDSGGERTHRESVRREEPGDPEPPTEAGRARGEGQERRAGEAALERKRELTPTAGTPAGTERLVEKHRQDEAGPAGAAQLQAAEQCLRAAQHPAGAQQSARLLSLLQPD